MACKKSGVIIQADGTIKEVEPADGKFFSLDELQKAVGGYIESIHLECGCIMFVNEEGKLNDLPLNQNATDLFVLSRVYSDDVIVGNVIVAAASKVN